jgi:hypothetical protein
MQEMQKPRDREAQPQEEETPSDSTAQRSPCHTASTPPAALSSLGDALPGESKRPSQVRWETGSWGRQILAGPCVQRGRLLQADH